MKLKEMYRYINTTIDFDDCVIVMKDGTYRSGDLGDMVRDGLEIDIDEKRNIHNYFGNNPYSYQPTWTFFEA